jgi:hypothetical protein
VDAGVEGEGEGAAGVTVAKVSGGMQKGIEIAIISPELHACENSITQVPRTGGETIPRPHCSLFLSMYLPQPGRGVNGIVSQYSVL